LTIYAAGLGTLWRVLESYGFDPRSVIGESDFSPGGQAPTGQRVSFERFDTLRTAAADLIGDPLIGLRSADHIHPSHFGALGFAWIASSSLLTGIWRVVRYGRMFNERETWSVVEGPAELELTAVLDPAVQRPDEVGDSLIAGMTALCRLNYGQDLNPERVTLTRPAPEDPGPWFSFFRCPVVFGSDGNRLVLSMKKATKFLPGSDPQIVALLERVIERSLASLDRDDIVNRARVEIVEQLPSGDVSEQSVAKALCMSKRTLHRRLRERGETFRSVLAGVRKELVQGYICDSSLDLTEIAFLLGYSDSSAFSRAFRRWFGRSPSQARAGDD